MSEPSSHNSDSFTVGDVLGDRYAIESVLDGDPGAMGRVYVARDQRLMRPVVVKTISTKLLSRDDRETFIQRFEAEAIAAAALNHPNIVPVHDYARTDDVVYYVMPKADGAMSLRQRIVAVEREGDLLPLDELREYALQAAAGLHAAHERCIVHRDIKPANLLVSQSLGQLHLQIFDFGLARFELSPRTHTGAILGTPQYVAPEGVQKSLGKKVDIDGRSDLFALGVTLYRCLTGELPFKGDHEIAVFQAICREVPELPSMRRAGLARSWDVITMTLLQKDPRARYNSAKSLHEALARLEDIDGPVPAPAVMIGSVVVPEGDDMDLGFLDGPKSRFFESKPFEDVSASGPQPSNARPVEASKGPAATDSLMRSSTRDGDPSRLDGEARQYVAALTEEKSGRLGTLRRTRKLGLAAAAFALIALAAGGGARLVSDDDEAGDSRQRVAFTSPTPASSSGAEAETPEDILRDEAKSHTRGMLGSARAYPAQPGQASREKPHVGLSESQQGSSVVAVDSPSRRRKRKPQAAARGLNGSATVASRAAETAIPPADKKKPQVPRRKDLASVIRFYEPPVAEESSKTDRQQHGNKLGIPTGSTVRARLVNGVTLSERVQSAPAVAELVTALVFPSAGEVLPRGTRLVGRAKPRVDGDSGRIEVVFSTLVLPDRTERSISAIATMTDGSVGISARVLSDERGNARELRVSLSTVSVPRGASFIVEFMRPV